ncbi:MAG: lysylphosphatidylglycerol synthase transmembrane domain-containing protein [Actinomycetota bacterium]|nr:lysylphosphatidylglycerol synthase transmembrane domain-containing protein [Actinomycetota bacterium]
MVSNKIKTILKIINVVVVVGFGLFLIWYLLSKIEIASIGQAFLNSYKPTMILGLTMMFFDGFLRGYRTKILLGSERIRMLDLFFVSHIRNAFNMVLPARTGELSYVYVLKRKFKYPVEVGVSTLAVALVFDMVIVFSLIIISIIIVGINRYSVSSTTVILVAAALLAVSLLILFFLSKIIGLVITLLKWVFTRTHWERVKFIDYIFRKLVGINKNIEIIQGRKIYTKVYISSVAIRLVKFSIYYFMIHSLMKPMGYGFGQLNYWVIFLATAAAEISAVLPTHALAGLGTYEFAFVSVLTMLGFQENIAIIVGFNYHIINLVFTVMVGILSIIIIVMPFYKIRKIGLDEDTDNRE